MNLDQLLKKSTEWVLAEWLDVLLFSLGRVLEKGFAQKPSGRFVLRCNGLALALVKSEDLAKKLAEDLNFHPKSRPVGITGEITIEVKEKR